jgi:hypothetical protein
MVTNSFGNKNFMQPMGRLSMHSKVFFFPFEVLGGWGGWGFFSFFFCSLQVPNGFPSGSQIAPCILAQHCDITPENDLHKVHTKLL